MGARSHEWTEIGFRALALAWSDDSFKRALIEDSRSALKTYFDYEIPEGENLIVTEGAEPSHDGMHLVLSPKPENLEDGPIEINVSPEVLQAIPCLCCICC